MGDIFELNPFKNIPDTRYAFVESPENYFDNGSLYFNEIYTEATNGANKKNIVQRLIDFIAKCFRWIGKQVSKVFDWVKSLFHKNKKHKSVDQIAVECKIIPRRNIDITSQDTNQNTNTNTQSSTENKKVTVNIPSNPVSEVNMNEKIDLAFKSFIVSFDGDKQSITLNFYKASNADDGNITGQKRTKTIANAILLICEPEHMENLNKVADIVISNTTLGQQFIDAYRNFDDAFAGKDSARWEFNLSEMMQFQVKLNELIKKIDKVNDIKDSIKYESTEALKTLNYFTNFCAGAQMSMNALTSALQNAYTISPDYLEAIDSPEDLSIFIAKCIEAGIPPKYIGYNAYCISSEKLKGDGSKGNKENPIWGQSRVVFFPNNSNIIYKIALSEWGTRSNLSEYNISNTFEKNGGGNYLALVKGTTNNNTVISSEKVDTENIDTDKIEVLRNKISNFVVKHKIPLHITDDMHKNNVGYKNGKLVFLDYGFPNRRNANSVYA